MNGVSALSVLNVFLILQDKQDDKLPYVKHMAIYSLVLVCQRSVLETSVALEMNISETDSLSLRLL